MRTWVQILRSHLKADLLACICYPRTPLVGWEAEARESPELQEPASPAYDQEILSQSMEKVGTKISACLLTST